MQIDCHQITYTYPGATRPVLQGLDLTINGPGFHALFGPSGVGKTSLAGLLYNERHYTFEGRITRPGVETCLYAYNQERLPGCASVGSHLDKIIPSEKQSLKYELVDDFGVSGCMQKRFSQLSLGQKNRVNLIRYLLQDFDLLIMDECLANVDERTRGEILLKMKDLFAERIFLYISHNVMEVTRYCDDILVLRDTRKTPQVIKVQGVDLRYRKTVDEAAQQKAMLEIMNA